MLHLLSSRVVVVVQDRPLLLKVKQMEGFSCSLREDDIIKLRLKVAKSSWVK